MRNAELTVHVSTKLNRSHVVTGRTALILPVLGRSERDLTGGIRQRVTSRTRCRRCTPRTARWNRRAPICAPRSTSSARWLRRCSATGTPSHGRTTRPTTPTSAEASRGWCRTARRTPRRSTDWAASCCRTDRETPDVPNSEQAAVFSVSPLDVLHVPDGRLLLQTLRSHDQFNTTIYGLDDRYRAYPPAAGWCSCTRTTSPHSACTTVRAGRPGQRVDRRQRAVREAFPWCGTRLRACAAAYYPEDQPAGAAGLDSDRQQLPDVEVDHRPAGARRSAQFLRAAPVPVPMQLRRR